jgi:hypothetical protein
MPRLTRSVTRKYILEDAKRIIERSNLLIENNSKDIELLREEACIANQLRVYGTRKRKIVCLTAAIKRAKKENNGVVPSGHLAGAMEALGKNIYMASRLKATAEKIMKSLGAEA